MAKKIYGKRAWLKVVEAVIAILIVLSAVIFITSSNVPKKDISSVAYEKEKYILSSISKNDTLRGNILSGNNFEVNKFVSKFIPSSWNFETKICEIEDICDGGSAIPFDKEVYASEIVITSYIGPTVSNYNPKKLRLFVWIK